MLFVNKNHKIIPVSKCNNKICYISAKVIAAKKEQVPSVRNENTAIIVEISL